MRGCVSGGGMLGAPVTIYFHGVPGGPRELTLFGAPVPDGWHAPDRSGLHPRLDFAEHCDALADEVRALAGGAPIRLAGFSLGAFIVLQVAHRLPDLRLTIDLISAAAPLQTGDYLDHMAGKPVFATATRSPALFGAMAAGQALAARLAPTRLAAALFASAQGEDRALAGNAAFHGTMAMILLNGLGHGRTNYVREIAAYVRDWATILPDIRHPVTLWHGAEDNWSPPAMVEVLAKRLPNVVALHRMPGLSHYSTLRAYLDALPAGNTARNG